MGNGYTRPIQSDIIQADYYDWLLEFNKTDGTVAFFYISDFLLKNGIQPANIHTFNELNQLFAQNLVITDEKEAYLDQLQLPNVLAEIEDKGTFIRTVHLDTTEGSKATSLRIKQIEGKDDHLLACLTDITQILDRDWMTDEYSRSGFLSRTEQLLKDPAYQQGYSVVYANIKGFKAINELLGTQSGDILIFQEKDALVNELHPVLIARLEADHYAALVKTEHITEETMERVCHRHYKAGTKQFPILIRCGIYTITDTSTEVSHMLDQARLAEKSISAMQNTTYVICNENMRQDYMNQRVFVSELDGALERGEFLPYYQPIVNAQTGEIVSAEALIRWKHSEKGMIPPGMFIPVFEKEGLTSKLDSFMINSILNFNIERLKKGQKTIPCAVNLSRVDFYDTKLLEILKKKLRNQENIHDMLKLEITESAYAELESDALEFLEEMNNLGLSFLLDDFGSGMSSLSTLELHDFDVIKLDMGFIRKIGKSKKAEVIIRHTIGMVHDMGAKVIAEGVEDKEQLEFLRSVGCDMIQGYYFYKPMPQEEFESLL